MVDFPSFPSRNIVDSALSFTYQKVLVCLHIGESPYIHPKSGTLIFRLSLPVSLGLWLLTYHTFIPPRSKTIYLRYNPDLNSARREDFRTVLTFIIAPILAEKQSAG